MHEYEGEQWIFAKGSAGGFKDIATTKIVDNEYVPLSDVDRQQISQMNDDMGSQAMRVIALLARKVKEGEDVEDIHSIESDLVFLGLIGIMDPPRPEVKAAIETCQRAGIKVKMITGDQQMTAAAIGAELNISSASGMALDGMELAGLSDEELVAATGGMDFVYGVGVGRQICKVIIDGHGVGVLGFRATTKSTEPAGENANVGLVDVNIGIEKRLGIKACLTNHIGQSSHFIQVRVMIQDKAILNRERTVGCQLRCDGFQRRRPLPLVQ